MGLHMRVLELIVSNADRNSDSPCILQVLLLCKIFCCMGFKAALSSGVSGYILFCAVVFFTFKSQYVMHIMYI